MTDIIVRELLKQVEASSGSTVFCASNHEVLTYGGLLDQINHVIEHLKVLGISSHDPVAFIADHEPATAILALSLMSHSVAVPVNPSHKQSENASLFSHVPVRAALVPKFQQKTLGRMFADLEIPVIEYELNHWEIRFESINLPDSLNQDFVQTAMPENTAVVLQTSGTTALPRNVPLTDENIFIASQNVIQSLSLKRKDICLHMLPLYHIGGLVDVLLAPLFSGGQVVFNRGFDADQFYKLNKVYRPTWTQTVPVMLQELIDHARQHEIDTADNRLRFIRSVSSPLPATLYDSASAAFSTSIVEIYGMTECGGVITSSPVEREKQIAGSVGISAGTDIRIVNENKEETGPMQTGEIQVRGPSVMQGYISRGSEKPGVDDIDKGWFNTGDLGYLNQDGYLFITGRIKDTINRGGEKISPVEVENVVLRHPHITDAACFSIPHPQLGEAIALAIVLKPGLTLSISELRQYLGNELAYFKVPTQIYYADEIPRRSGKLNRRHLALHYAETVGTEPVFNTPVNVNQTELTKLLVELWSSVLKVEAIGPGDDFFYLGGDSLSATILVNKIQEQWQVPVLVSSIYDAPVLEEYEQYIRKNYPDFVDKITD